MTKIVRELVELGRNMKTEQSRVEKLLNSKDLLIRKLQEKVENQKESTKQGSDSGYENRINDDISDDTENITSDSVREIVNDKFDIENKISLFEPKNKIFGIDIVSDKAEIENKITPPEANNKTSDLGKHQSLSNISGPKAISSVPNVASMIGPKPPIASRESVNAKLHLAQPKMIDYVLVTKKRSDISHISGLYVLDTASDVGEDISGVATNDNNTVTPVHAMTNHRQVLKPSDIKYRDKRRAVSMSDKTRVTYWTDTYL